MFVIVLFNVFLLYFWTCYFESISRWQDRWAQIELLLRQLLFYQSIRHFCYQSISNQWKWRQFRWIPSPATTFLPINLTFFMQSTQHSFHQSINNHRDFSQQSFNDSSNGLLFCEIFQGSFSVRFFRALFWEIFGVLFLGSFQGSFSGKLFRAYFWESVQSSFSGKLFRALFLGNFSGFFFWEIFQALILGNRCCWVLSFSHQEREVDPGR